jgi:valyl-tRNA synthetase
MKKFLTILFLLAAFNFAQAQTSDESYKKALVKLFEASNTTNTFRIAISSLFKTIKKSRTDVDESTWNTLEEEMGNLTADDFAEIYLDTYKPLLTERSNRDYKILRIPCR